MKGNGRRTNAMVKVLNIIMTIHITKGNGMKIKSMGMEFYMVKMENTDNIIKMESCYQRY